MNRKLLAALALALLPAGCGTGDDRDQARATVERFYDALRAGDGAAACAELGDSTIEQVESQSGQSCREVVTRLEYDGGAVLDVEVAINNAKADLRSGESAFLSREPDGWKLTAIGCKAADGKPADRPFDCEAEA